MIQVLFIVFLLIVLFLMYKNDNNIINKTVNNLKQEAFHGKRKKFTYDPYKSQPLILKNKQLNNLLTEETTGIDRSKFENIQELEYLGEIESRPSPYNKVRTRRENDYKILETEDPYLKGIFNMTQYNK